MTRVWADSIGPIDGSWPVQDQVAALQQLKNGLIGLQQRKLAFLRRTDIVASVVKALASPPANARAEDACAMCIQAAGVLGAGSMPSNFAITTLLQARAHLAIAQCLVLVIGPVPSAAATWMPSYKFVKALAPVDRIKLSESLLRALKTLCVDYSTRRRAQLGRDWDVLSNPSPLLSETVTSDTVFEQASNNGGNENQRDDGRTSSQMDEVIKILLGVSSTGTQEPTDSGAPLLVEVLLECAAVTATETSRSGLQRVPTVLSFNDSSTARTRFADLACVLLATVVKGSAIDMSSFHMVMWAPDLLRALTVLIRTGNGRMRESALAALSALARGKSKIGMLLARRGAFERAHITPKMTANPLYRAEEGQSLTELQFITELCEASSPSLRLSAIICRTIIHKSLKDYPAVVSSWELAQPMVPTLLALIEKEPALRPLATFALTFLISDNEELQRQAVKLKTLEILRAVLEDGLSDKQLYDTTSSREQITRTQEGVFLCIACICSRSEAYRHSVLAAKLLPSIVRALSHPAAGVRAAACHCIRGLGRSVNVLRTSLVDTGAAGPLCHLLRDDEDLLVQTTAAAAVSNLVLEFSPLRQILIDRGCIPRLCLLAHKNDKSLRLNALWSLKNASYQSTSSFKRTLAAELGWSFLADLIEVEKDTTVVEQALGILRNLTCTYGDDAVTGLDESEMGEEKMLRLVEHALQSTSQEIALQALYTVVNLATASESTKLAIAARTNLLRSIKLHLSSTHAETRSASVWCVINLCYVERSSFRRRPREILDKLKALGVDDELRRMSADETSLDVRERVRDAMEVFVGGSGTHDEAPPVSLDYTSPAPAMATLNKAIAPVPSAAQFLDVVLSSTQRKTPTVIRSGFKITRIRSFYMRKVKFTQTQFEERLDRILGDFPQMDNLHPFLSALLNVLYDKNHYKLALGQLNTARHLISQVGKDYCRLLKFGDSLYRCKQLKRAALGRMATIMKRQKDPLAYLEEVRQHMSRLPSIDPTTRTLLICGYPNVGKSSFVNKVTRADVDVQPYAFTTKSLFVGHMDYKYLRWQVIDTPGVLDHPLEEMNTIEMQSITALAHLRSCVMYFMDLSEQCGYTVEAQCKLYQSIKPLFANKPTFIVVNKIDVVRPSELDAERKAMLDQLLEDDNVKLLELSCISEEGVMNVRNTACDALLAHRVESKEKTKRVDNVANRVRVAMPVPRDGAKREPFIPQAVLEKKKYDKNDPNRRKLERDYEEEAGGAGVWSFDMKKNYMLANDDWKYDVMPEIQDGKNVADFIDPDIVARLEELEAEEERLEAAGFYDSDEEEDSDEDAIRTTAEAIRDKKANLRMLNQEKNKLQNKAIIPRTAQRRNLSEVTSKLSAAGYDTTNLEERAKLLAKARGLVGKKRGSGEMDVDDDEDVEADWQDADDSMDVEDGGDGSARKKQRTSATSIVPKGKRVPTKNRAMDGLGSAANAAKATRLHELYQREPNRKARAGESDRHIATRMPKHLFSGKRKSGTNNRR
ncbi:Nucleolar GTP-binding protein 1 [Microbotryomycetes sp. JL201]|nr:Nucleolar GTP-binding protein 1 [Microbotryomycetes sp. JL201]